MADAVLMLYAVGFLVVFLVCCFMCEKVEGRNCTGKSDFEAALFIAFFWPMFAAILLFFWVSEQRR